MSTGNLIYRSRIVTEDLQFTANGETSWSFIAEGDGEIYAVESDNVAGYTINGGAVVLPFSLVNGNSYTVAITKTTLAQVADIQFKTRRSVNKTKTVNVPDFGAYDGRYLYLLMKTTNEVIKIDTDLLTVGSYSGAGVWVSPPIVATITLPTLPNASEYNSITFVQNDGVGKIFLQGGTITGSYEVYASYLLDDDTVVDMDLSIVVPYTLIGTGNLKKSSGNCVYNYLQEKVYIALGSIGNGERPLVYDLINKTSSEQGVIYGNSAKALPSNKIRSCQFIVQESRFSFLADVDLDTNRYFNYKPGQNGGNVSSYAFSLNATDRNNGTIQVRDYFDAFGVLVLRMSVPSSPIGGAPTQRYSTDESLTLDVLKSTLTIYRQSYSIANYDGGNSSASDVLDFEVGASYLKSIMGSNRALQFYALSTNGSSKRLFVFDPTQDPMQFAYLDLPSDAEQMHTNQLML